MNTINEQSVIEQINGIMKQVAQQSYDLGINHTWIDSSTIYDTPQDATNAVISAIWDFAMSDEAVHIIGRKDLNIIEIGYAQSVIAQVLQGIVGPRPENVGPRPEEKP